MDKGPWVVLMHDGKAEVFSIDFDHDVMLRIDGDFESNEQRTEYAYWLASTLNDANALRAKQHQRNKE